MTNSFFKNPAPVPAPRSEVVIEPLGPLVAGSLLVGMGWLALPMGLVWWSHAHLAGGLGLLLGVAALVLGWRHIYKIHLGSGNILMEPNDQYLCIVPDRSAKTLGDSAIFLPFEGDAVLSIILSKAQLLLNDDKITYSTILRQL